MTEREEREMARLYAEVDREAERRRDAAFAWGVVAGALAAAAGIVAVEWLLA